MEELEKEEEVVYPVLHVDSYVVSLEPGKWKTTTSAILSRTHSSGGCWWSER